MNMALHIHESNLIEGIDDEQADKDCMAAWERLLTYDHLTHYVVKQLQRMITQHQTDLKPEWRGKYRKIPVWIGGREAPHYSEIETSMNVWLASFVKSLDPKDAHIQFEHIHPFVDGNGRTGRMLMWWMEIKAGQEPTLLWDSEKQDYYRWFK